MEPIVFNSSCYYGQYLTKENRAIWERSYLSWLTVSGKLIHPTREAWNLKWLCTSHRSLHCGFRWPEAQRNIKALSKDPLLLDEPESQRFLPPPCPANNASTIWGQFKHESLWVPFHIQTRTLARTTWWKKQLVGLLTLGHSFCHGRAKQTQW